MKNTYNQMMEQYPKGDSKEMINYLATPLLDVYKMSLKSQQLPWKLENNCVSASIVQGSHQLTQPGFSGRKCPRSTVQGFGTRLHASITMRQGRRSIILWRRRSMIRSGGFATLINEEIGMDHLVSVSLI